MASRTKRLRGKPMLVACTAALALTGAGCMTASSGADAAAPAPASVNTISQADKAEGAKAHPQLIAEFGGAVSGPQADYVESVGKTIAMQSGLGNARSDFTVTLLNSPVNNAFAIPGGYVYVTRQLTALMNNEAELAGVLGHEVGHVAARHSAKRQKAATRNSIIGVLGSILSGVLLGDSSFGQLGQRLFSQGSQLLTLKYSRGQETEADNLGIAYLNRAGYDPRAMSTVLQSLARQNALESQLRGSRNQVPEWASTHPDPASRVREALARAGTNATGLTNRDTFLGRIDGLVYGDDPKQGIVDGSNFIHPELRLRFEAPDGYYMVNGTRSVSISGETGKAEFTTGSFDGNLDTYITQAFAGLTESNQQTITPQSIERTTINGLPAAYGTARVQGSNGPLDVVVFAYDFGGGKAYHFTTITQAGRAGVFNPMFKSMQRISTAEAGAVKARRLEVVTIRPGDTLQSLAARMAYDDAKLERFLVLNNLSTASRIVPGEKVKIVSY
ncbi:peptidase M48 Ste24p [Novosphingobium sp. PC22D]|uniref:M48 family metalloprotease n=1 Tax=Novosphingobium sp. PC22D TaxID=1962403 RepID=UPI000BF24AB5|nr:M48 family metalloprotease [Novosphingobium sp. PC22D]PEQ11449.1 peptidase M48 Ste24p [Novosphingobium sp. PC22D]